MGSNKEKNKIAIAILENLTVQSSNFFSYFGGYNTVLAYCTYKKNPPHRAVRRIRTGVHGKQFASNWPPV